MFVVAHVEDKDITVHCGDGEQSVKWLALAASRRYAELLTPKGRVRWRETSQDCGGILVPCGIRRRESDKDLEPNLKVNEMLGSGDHVNILLRRKVSYAGDGSVRPTPWEVQAFSTDSELQRKTTVRIKQSLESAETKRRDEERKQEVEAEHIFGKADSNLAKMFRKDWDDICGRNQNASNPLAPEIEMKSLRRSFAQYYQELSNAFEYFTGGNFGEITKMEYTEFAHFTHRTRIADAGKDRKLIQKIVSAVVSIEVKKGDRGEKSLKRSQFMEIATRLVLESAEKMTACDAVQRLVQDHLLPWIEKHRENVMFQSLAHPDFEEIVQKNVGAMKRVFDEAVRRNGKRRKKKGARSGPFASNTPVIRARKGQPNWTLHDDNTLSLEMFNRALRVAGCVSKKSYKKSTEKKNRRGGGGGGGGGARSKAGTGSKKKNREKGGLSDSSTTAASSRNEGGISRLVRSAFLSAAWGRPVRPVDVETDANETDETADFEVILELTFPEFLEALFEFSTLKTRQEIMVKARKANNVLSAASSSSSTATTTDSSMENKTETATPREILEKFVEVTGSLLGALS